MEEKQKQLQPLYMRKKSVYYCPLHYTGRGERTTLEVGLVWLVGWSVGFGSLFDRRNRVCGFELKNNEPQPPPSLMTYYSSIVANCRTHLSLTGYMPYHSIPCIATLASVNRFFFLFKVKTNDEKTRQTAHFFGHQQI